MRRAGLLGFLLLSVCRSTPPAVPRPPLTVRVWERTIVGTHYEALLSLKPDRDAYAFTFTCTARLVYRNDCPCDTSRGVLPDSVILPWIHRILHLPDTLEPWADASLTRVVVPGNPSRVIRYPDNLLRELFPKICSQEGS